MKSPYNVHLDKCLFSFDTTNAKLFWCKPFDKLILKSQSRQRRLTNMSQLSQEREEREKAPKPTAQDWAHPMESHAVLDGLGYVWHPKLFILICLTCRSAVSPGGLRPHSEKANHTFAKEHVISFVANLAKDCKFEDREGRVPALKPGERVCSWPYLDTDNAYQCPACSKCYGKIESVKGHYRKIHGTSAHVSFERLRCQELFKAQGRDGIWVPVNEDGLEKEGTGVGGEIAVIAQALQVQLAQHLQGSFTVDWKVKDAWPYLKAVPWHSVVEANRDQYETAELRAMVSIPHMHSEAVRCTFPARLAIFVQNWVLGLEMEVRQADYRLKQLLGTDSGE